MIRPALVSVTFRQLASQEIVALARDVGLAGIEWGGDIHVPHGDLSAAREVRAMTEDAGLASYAYGSYYRAGHSENEGLSFATVRDTACELHARTIRVWAGRQDAEDADATYRQTVIDDIRRIADLAEQVGLIVALEFHGHTLTNTAASCRQLIADISHSSVRTYWQPPIGANDAECREGLQLVLPFLQHLHVFHWGRMPRDRLPLAEGASRWQGLFEFVRSSGREHFAALEFVRDDSPAAFREDASSLLAWVGRRRRKSSVDGTEPHSLH